MCGTIGLNKSMSRYQQDFGISDHLLNTYGALHQRFNITAIFIIDYFFLVSPFNNVQVFPVLRDFSEHLCLIQWSEENLMTNEVKNHIIFDSKCYNLRDVMLIRFPAVKTKRVSFLGKLLRN